MSISQLKQDQIHWAILHIYEKINEKRLPVSAEAVTDLVRPKPLSPEEVKAHVPARGRGKAQRSLELVAAAQGILAEIQPATVRAVVPAVCRQAHRLHGEKNTSRVSVQLTWARSSLQLIRGTL